MSDVRPYEAASGVVESVSFGFFTAEEITKISVKAITMSAMYDIKGIPVPDGLCDPALGPINDKDSCKSCGLLSFGCPGHCGHIDLALPVFNPLLFPSLYNLLQVTCIFCHRFRMKETKVQYYISKLNLIQKGDIAGARNLKQPLALFHSKKDGAEDMDTGDTVEDGSSFIEEETFASSAESQKQTWTSLQHTEASSVLVDIMHEKFKECQNCGRKNPKITSPLHGVIDMAMRDADIRANVINGLSAENVSAEPLGDVPNTAGMLSEMETGLESNLSTSAETSKWKNLPANFIQQKKFFSTQLIPSQVKVILKNLWRKEGMLCKLICDIQQTNLKISVEKDYNIFFLDALIVPANKFRPTTSGSERGRALQHPQNVLLIQVLDSNIALRDAKLNNSEFSVVSQKWKDLQRSVNVLFDSSKGFGKDKEATGLRQLLEKKAGILRQKMMGKRVNFACRSVISPDPFLAVNEIGVPPHFALALTYPERVTPWNANELRHAIVNGADTHPGATHFKDKQERIYRLNIPRHARLSISRKISTSRSSLIRHGKDPESDFEGKIVHRHLRNGDIVLVNRQPTLHKLSIKGHVVRILEGERTLRFHYTNCNSYNADFDGDEMNVHFPQDEISRSEAINIVDANRQYTVPTSGKPDRGLIQDHIVSAVLLTKLDTFLTRADYHHLLYASCIPPTCSAVSSTSGKKVYTLYSDGKIQPLSPAIWKPVPLWTGKQVISAILNYVTRGHLPCTVKKIGKISSDYLGGDGKTFKGKEHKVRIVENELLHGIIDKEQFGFYGLVHTVHELYGSDVAGALLSSFSRLFTIFLQMHGFTCGLDDLLIVPESEHHRYMELEKSEEKSKEAHYSFLGINPGDAEDPRDMQMRIEKAHRENGESATTILDRKMSNAMNDVTSTVTRMLFPKGLQKPFVRNCVTLMTTTGAKGSLVNFTQISSLLGQQQLEGKRVPSMVSGKTLPSFPPYDTSPRAGGFISDRFLTGLRPQEYYFHCMAGREGLVDTAIKTSRSGYLQRCLIKNLESLKVCYDHTVRDADGSIVQFLYGEDGVDAHQTGFLNQFKSLDANRMVIVDRLSRQGLDSDLPASISYFRDLPEKIKHGVEVYIDTMSKKRRKKKKFPNVCKKGDLLRLMELKYLSSLCPPGEAVGVLAAQSVGEPSTQMTLNTFHLAGRGEVNVTLGIPRLQEILLSAKQAIKTPTMTCPLREGLTDKDAHMLAAKLRRVSVADIIESMEVRIVPLVVSRKGVSTTYKLRIKVYDPRLFPPHIGLSLDDCMSILETDFVVALESAVKRHVSAMTRFRGIQVGSRVRNASADNEEDETGAESEKLTNNKDDDGSDDGDNEDDEDQGADAEKRKMQGNDEMEYDDDNEKTKAATLNSQAIDVEASETESEVDQGESDEDQAVEEEAAGTTDDVEELEKLSGVEDESGSVLGEQTPKSKEKKAAMKKRKKSERVIYVKAEGHELEIHFTSQDEPHLLLAEIAQKTAKNVYLKRADNIEFCTALLGKDERKRETWILQTAGVDFAAFWNLEEYLDINKICSNDIFAILSTYGVEAARATIVSEVSSLFKAYGVSVDVRHLNLIADFMTRGGDYRPMNRKGMTSYSTSPFGKITFETAAKFIVEAAFHGEVDTLEGTSSSICLGQPVKLGTGMFDVLQNL